MTRVELKKEKRKVTVKEHISERIIHLSKDEYEKLRLAYCHAMEYKKSTRDPKSKPFFGVCLHSITLNGNYKWMPEQPVTLRVVVD